VTGEGNGGEATPAAAHPQATGDALDAAVQRQLAPVQAPVVAELSAQAAAAEQAVPEAADAPEVCCPQGGATMQRRGTRARQVPTRQGVWVAVRRADAPCPACGAGHFI
jgi:hypothetical protein